MGELFDSATSFFALRAAARRAALGCSRSFGAASFLCELETEVLRLQRELHSGIYRPGPFHTFPIRDPKPRLISAAPFRDRVVHHALCATILPTLEAEADPDSFACRVGKGTLKAIHRAQHLSRQFPYFAKMDVLHCFETADLSIVGKLLSDRFPDPAFLATFSTILDNGADHGARDPPAEVADRPGSTKPVEEGGSRSNRGLPIGNLTSQHLANLLLGEVDRAARAMGVRGWVRYMDDLLLFGDSMTELRTQVSQLSLFLQVSLHQQEKRVARRIGPVTAGLPFLGFRIWPQRKRLDGARRRRLFARLRVLDGIHAREESAIGAGLAHSREQPTRAPASAKAVLSWVSHADTLGLRRSALRPCVGRRGLAPLATVG